MTTAIETRDLTNETFSRVAEVRDQEGSFYIVKKGKKNTRVLLTSDPKGSGVLVRTEDLANERDVQGETPPSPPTPSTPRKKRQRFVRK